MYNVTTMHAMNNATAAKMVFDDAAKAFKVHLLIWLKVPCHFSANSVEKLCSSKDDEDDVVDEASQQNTLESKTRRKESNWTCFHMLLHSFFILYFRNVATHGRHFAKYWNHCFSRKILFISIVWEQKTLILANVRGNHTPSSWPISYSTSKSESIDIFWYICWIFESEGGSNPT